MAERRLNKNYVKRIAKRPQFIQKHILITISDILIRQTIMNSTMKIKHTIAAMLAMTLAADAAITISDVSATGNFLTVKISGTLDLVGGGNDLNNRRLLFFADARLGNGVGQPIPSGTPLNLTYENWFGGAADSTGHTLSGSLGGVTLGAIQSTGGLSTSLSGTQTSITIDGDDSAADLVRGRGTNAGGIDYVVLGFGDNVATGSPYNQLAVGTELDFTIGIDFGTSSVAAFDTKEEFADIFALYANDGVDNAGVNADYTNYNQITAVPEPSSAALLGLGGLALILRRRK